MARTWLAISPGETLPTTKKRALRQTCPENEPDSTNTKPATHTLRPWHQANGLDLVNPRLARPPPIPSRRDCFRPEAPSGPWPMSLSENTAISGRLNQNRASRQSANKRHYSAFVRSFQPSRVSMYASLHNQQDFPTELSHGDYQLPPFSFRTAYTAEHDVVIGTYMGHPMGPSLIGTFDTMQKPRCPTPWANATTTFPPASIATLGRGMITTTGPTHRGNNLQSTPSLRPEYPAPTVAQCTAVTRSSRQPPSLDIPRGLESGRPTGLLTPVDTPGILPINRPSSVVHIPHVLNTKRPATVCPDGNLNGEAAIPKQQKRSFDHPSRDPCFGARPQVACNFNHRAGAFSRDQGVKHARFQGSAPRTARNVARPIAEAANPKAGEPSRRTCCSEDPFLFQAWSPSATAQTSSDQSINKPEHSATVFPCANTFAHRGTLHGVCSTCRNGATAYIMQQMPELYIDNWWPLCRTCGDTGLNLVQKWAIAHGAVRMGCSCHAVWFCFQCRLRERHVTKIKSEHVAISTRQPVNIASLDEKSAVLLMGWRCVCQNQIMQDANVMKCAGCEGLDFGAWSYRYAKDKAAELSRRACNWT